MSLHDLLRMSHVGLTDSALSFAFGEVSQYDPVLHRARFKIQINPDDDPAAQGDGLETEFIPVGTPFTAASGGMQFPLETGMQGLVIFIETNVPVAACMFFNNVETAPFPEGDTRGWKDDIGSYITTDDEGYARIVGNSYTELGGKMLNKSLQGVVRFKDLQIVVNAFNALVSVFNSHVHHGVSAGSAVSGVTSTPATDTTTQSSETVFSQD